MNDLLQDVDAMRAAVGETGHGGACAFQRRQGDQGEAIRARRRAVIRRDSMLADGLRAAKGRAAGFERYSAESRRDTGGRAPADDKLKTPEIPRVIVLEENPIHLELDLLGLLPVVGEPADLVNALIYAWERDWGNAEISLLGVVPVVGSVGTLARIGSRAGDVATVTRPRLTQDRLEHIVRRHWSTAGTPRHVGKFRDGLSLSTLTAWIDAALRHGATRPNTGNHLGTIYEIDLVGIIGVNGSRKPTSRLRVIVNELGEIVTAFPY